MFSKLIAKIRDIKERKKEKNLAQFQDVIEKLEHLREKPSLEFEQDLRRMLRAHHQALAEKRLGRQTRVYFYRKLALAFSVLVLVLGSWGAYNAIPVPVAESKGQLQFLKGPLPGGQLPEGPIIAIDFSQPMVKASVERAFRIEPAVEGTFKWEGKTLLFIPKEKLDPKRKYRVTIGDEARSIFRKKFKKPFQQVFQFSETDEETETPPSLLKSSRKS